jgi:hypothetical protein
MSDKVHPIGETIRDSISRHLAASRTSAASGIFHSRPSAADASSRAFIERAVAKCQALTRSHIVRRLIRSEVNTAEVRRAIHRVNTDRVGFCQLLA